MYVIQFLFRKIDLLIVIETCIQLLFREMFLNNNYII